MTVLGGHREGRSLPHRKRVYKLSVITGMGHQDADLGPHWAFLAFPNMGWVVYP